MRLVATSKLILALALLLGMGAVAGDSLASARVEAQAGAHHAGLVVQYGDGSAATFCVAFDGDSITGLDVLQKAGLDLTIEYSGSLGAGICMIGADGCDYPAEPCLCKSYGPGGLYWVYSHLKGGVWKLSSLGASSYGVHDGDVEGWAWSAGKSPSKVLTFAQLCPNVQPAQPTQPKPTSTPIPPQPTSTPIPPRATATPIPPRPTSTKRPTLPPQPTATPHRPRPTNTTAPTALAPTRVSKPAPALTPTPTIPTQAPTSTPTHAATDTPTPLPTSTPLAPADTPLPSATPTPASTPTPLPSPSPTAVVQSANGSAQGVVQIVAIGIGVAVVGGLVLWRVLGGRGGR